MNRAMVKQHVPLLLRSQFPLGTVDDGSGILLGASAGVLAVVVFAAFATVGLPINTRYAFLAAAILSIVALHLLTD